jgi:hypothetical protein
LSVSAREPQQAAGQYDQSRLVKTAIQGRLAHEIGIGQVDALRPVFQCHNGPVSGSTFVSTLLRASFRERWAMTASPRRSTSCASRRGASRENGTSCPLRLVELRKGCHRRDHGARRIEGDMNALALASRVIWFARCRACLLEDLWMAHQAPLVEERSVTRVPRSRGHAWPEGNLSPTLSYITVVEHSPTEN